MLLLDTVEMLYFVQVKLLCKHIDPKVIGGHIKIFRKYTWNFFEKPGNIIKFCQSGNVGTLNGCFKLENSDMR